jgi:transcriptional regulator with XRE-family HTH domain
VAGRTETALRALGLRIQELRRERGETQESFAVRVRMLAPNFARIEQGRMNVTVDTLVRIASALRVELSELFVEPTGKKQKPGRPRKDRP